MEPREILLSPIKIGKQDCQNRFFSQAMDWIVPASQIDPAAGEVTTRDWSRLVA